MNNNWLLVFLLSTLLVACGPADQTPPVNDNADKVAVVITGWGEPKGFDLNGTYHLPDFHLTNGLVLYQFQPTQLDQIWVEIKPHPELSDEERKKMAEFVKQTDHHILLIAGQPG